MILFGLGFLSGIIAVVILSYFGNKVYIKKQDTELLRQYKQYLEDGE